MLYTKKELPDLYQVISENAPDAIKTGEIKNHFGRKVAIVCSRQALFCTIILPTLTYKFFDRMRTS
jgi:hypothetical protein